MKNRVWIDCEFNGFQGDLISMALVHEVTSFYEVLHCPTPVPWVEENVVPVLGQQAIGGKAFKNKLQNWLCQFDTVHIIADWPDDIKYFCQAVITGPGERIKMPDVTMEIDHSIEAVSEIPHNALMDAQANRKFCLLREQKK